LQKLDPLTKPRPKHPPRYPHAPSPILRSVYLQPTGSPAVFGAGPSFFVPVALGSHRSGAGVLIFRPRTTKWGTPYGVSGMRSGHEARHVPLGPSGGCCQQTASICYAMRPERSRTCIASTNRLSRVVDDTRDSIGYPVIFTRAPKANHSSSKIQKSVPPQQMLSLTFFPPPPPPAAGNARLVAPTVAALSTHPS